jgi:Dynamin family
MSLADKIAANAKKIVESVGPHMDLIADIGEKIEQADTASKIRAQRALLDADTFWLIVLGRFRNGKSTFLNALLCEFTHPVPDLPPGLGPMPVSDLPTTAVLTTINYNRVASVVANKVGPRKEHWSLKRYLEEAKIKRDPEENERYWREFVDFDVKLPSRTLQSGITLLDPPGVDDIAERTEIVTAATQKCDSGIVLLRSDSLGGEDERKFIQSLYDCGLKDVFFVINRRDGRVVDEELKQEAWNRIVHMAQGGPSYTRQNLADKHIYFVDAKAALEGQIRSDRRKLAESGMLEFESCLSDFLEKERRAVHLARFVNGVNSHGKRLQETIEKLIPGLKAKEADLRKNYEALKPEIENLRKRVNQLPEIVQQYCEKAIFARDASFREAVNDLCRDLPTEMKKKRIPLIDDAGVIGRIAVGIRKNKVYKQTAEAAQEICDMRLKHWFTANPPAPGAQTEMKRIVERMIEEISDKIKDIKKCYDGIQTALTGSAPELVGTHDHSSEEWAKRIWSGALVFLSPDYGVSYMNEGIGGLGKSMLVHAGAAALVLFLGGPAGWALAAGIAAGLIRTAIFAPEQMKERVRQQVVDACINGIPPTKDSPRQPGLRELADAYVPKLRADVTMFFSELEKGLRISLKEETDAEEAAIRKQLSNASKSVEEKQALIKILEQYRESIRKSRTALEDAVNVVRGNNPNQ